MIKQLALSAVMLLTTWSPTMANEPFDFIDNIVRISTLNDAELAACGYYSQGGVVSPDEFNQFAPMVLENILRATGYVLSLEEQQRLEYIKGNPDYDKIRSAYLVFTPNISKIDALDARIKNVPWLVEGSDDCLAVKNEAMKRYFAYTGLKDMELSIP